MRILIAFTSLSGNTRDVARQVRARCESAGHQVSWVEAGVNTLADAGDPRHDLYVLGAWTDNAGRTPREVAQLRGYVEIAAQLAPTATPTTGPLSMARFLKD